MHVELSMCVENPLQITSVFPTEIIANGIIKIPGRKKKKKRNPFRLDYIYKTYSSCLAMSSL